jgi:hypothetical protein
VTTSSNDNSKSVATVVTEANFLVSPTEDFDFYIWHINLSNFVLCGINDEYLLRDCSFVFSSGKKNPVA